MPKAYVQNEYAPKISITKLVVKFIWKNLSVQAEIYDSIPETSDRKRENLLTQTNEHKYRIHYRSQKL